MQPGKISPTDLRIILGLLPVLEQGEAEARAILLENHDQFFASDCVKSYWCQYYEMPFPEHVGKVIGFFGLTDEMKAIDAAPNQIQAAASFLEGLDEEPDFTEENHEMTDQLRRSLTTIFGISLSMMYSIRCLMAFGCYLNDLIATVRLGGSKGDKALFNAVRIDPTVVGCHSVLARISQAAIANDKKFLKKLKGAIDGKLTKQQQANFEKMRFVLKVLQEAGAIRLSDAQLYELFVEELKLYTPDSRQGDVHKNLRTFADRYMKVSATT